MMKDAKPVEKSSGNGHNSHNTIDIENAQEILKRPQPCRKQVYSSLSVAESTASAMLRMGFLKEARVEKCGRCGLIHVREVRQEIATRKI